MSEAHQALKSSSRFHHERDGAQETSMGAAKVDQKRDARAKFFKFSRFRPMSEAHQALKSSSRFHQPPRLWAAKVKKTRSKKRRAREVFQVFKVRANERRIRHLNQVRASTSRPDSGPQK